MAQEKRKMGLLTEVAFGGWAALFLVSAFFVPKFYTMFAEGPGDTYPLVTRLIVNIPTAGWIALAVLVPGGLILKWRLLGTRTGELVDMIAVCALIAFVFALLVALQLPMYHCVNSFPAPRYIIPAPR